MNFIVVANGFECGGVTSAMKNLCNELVRRGHGVDLLNLPGTAALPEGFDRRIGLLPLRGFSRYWNLGIAEVHAARGMRKIFLLLLGIFKKITNRGSLWRKIVFRGLRMKKHYDVSIGFRQSPVSYWLAGYKCNSGFSLGFWHADADFENISRLEECLRYPDKICCVSDAITRRMKIRYPELREKFNTVCNIFDAASIIRRGNAVFREYEDDVFNIVTVGRLSRPKRLTVIPPICARLKQCGMKFRWYVIGEGEMRPEIERAVRECDVADRLALPGEKENPFPYIKNADLFVLTSEWESYGMVVTEALILGTPVVAGDYPALHEILDDGVNGIIAPNTEDGIFETLRELMTRREKYEKIKSGAEEFAYSSDRAVDQLLSLCNKASSSRPA